MASARKLLCGVLAAVALLACAHTALGRGFMFRPGGRISLVSRERVILRQEDPFEIGEDIKCDLTLEGSLTRSTFEKRVGTNVGALERATVGRCEGGELRISGLPQPIFYQGFEGTLPEITGLRLSTGTIEKLIFEIITSRSCGYSDPMWLVLPGIPLSGMRGLPEAQNYPTPFKRLELESSGLNRGLFRCNAFLILLFIIPLRSSTGGTETLALI